MSIAKLPVSKRVNITVETESNDYTYDNVKEYHLPASMTDTPILKIVKKDGNMVSFNWLHVTNVEEITDEELSELNDTEQGD